jgi:ATP-dependent Clp protease adapter protein ClpS
MVWRRLMFEKGNKSLKKYFVVLQNDDHNSMDKVVVALHLFAGMTLAEATLMALAVHENGAGAVGVWHHEVAETILARLVETGLTAKLAEDKQE